MKAEMAPSLVAPFHRRWSVWVSPLADCAEDRHRAAQPFVATPRAALDEQADMDRRCRPVRTLDELAALRLWRTTPGYAPQCAGARSPPLVACLEVQNTAELCAALRAGAHVIHIEPHCHGLVFQVVTLASSLATYRKASVVCTVATVLLAAGLPNAVRRHASERLVLAACAAAAAYSALRHLWLSFRLAPRFLDYDVVKFSLPDADAPAPVALDRAAVVSRQASESLLASPPDVAECSIGATSTSSRTTYATPLTSPGGSSVELAVPASGASSTLSLAGAPADDSSTLLLGDSSVIDVATPRPANSPMSTKLAAAPRQLVLVRCDVSIFHYSRAFRQRVRDALSNLEGLASAPPPAPPVTLAERAARVLSASTWTRLVAAPLRRRRSQARWFLYGVVVMVAWGTGRRLWRGL